MKKPFKLLAYGERFRMPAPLSHHMSVKIGHNLVADWPVTLHNHRGEPIQGICSWITDHPQHGEPDMDTEVEVVDCSTEADKVISGLLGQRTALQYELRIERKRCADEVESLKADLTKARELLGKLSENGYAQYLIKVSADELKDLLAHQSAPAPLVCECGPLRNITDGGHFPACTRCNRRLKP